MKTIFNLVSRCFIVILIFMVSCSKPPVLTTIVPTTAYPRQVLNSSGSNSTFARAVWDNGLSTEATLKSNFLSARYFQLPDVASTGNHPVALRNSVGTSTNVIDVNVLSSSGSWPNPRIEDIGINNVFNRIGSSADFFLAVSAANSDADAVINIDGVDVPTIFTSAITSDYLNSHTPSTYNYPIYHYGLHLAFIEGQTWGNSITVQLRNHDGSLSTSRTYEFAASEALLDSDNDGLLDEWEINGFTAASGNVVDLQALGCSPKRKDVLVEVDWISAATPDSSIWTSIESVFSQAPVLNPDGSSGIAVHIDRGQGGAFTNGGTILANHTTMDFGTNPAAGYTDFFTYKGNATNFNPDRRDIFHYGIIGRARPNGSSGRGEVFGNDFMVTFLNFTGSNAFSTPRNQIGTFVHEFGHNINLCHGGQCGTTDRNETFKVNQPSLMNYRYQFPAVSNDCDLTSDNVFDFSRGMFNTIIETSVSEANGICDNNALDFNGDGDTSDSGAINVNPSTRDSDATDTLIDYNEWGVIRFDFTASGSRWNNN